MLAALIASVRDFAVAEDALQDAVEAALRQWPREGTPRNPAAWLTAVARRRAIDRLRRDVTLMRKQATLQTLADLEATSAPPAASSDGTDDDARWDELPDERLKLFFTCCHPALSLEARIALTLHTLGGLATDEIAHAFLVSETTMAQRLTRARRKIRDAGIPYAVPPLRLLPERLEGTLTTLYLIFNEGYTTSAGTTLMRRELCSEAIRLTRALATLLAREPTLPAEPEATGLLALMLLTDARRAARVDASGDLVTLEDQDRSLWDRAEIAEGLALLDEALTLRRRGPYQLQAAISALHAQAASANQTDWRQIALLYGALAELTPSPVVELNRAVAVALADGPAAGLALLDAPLLAARLDDYHLYHAARADLHRRSGDVPAAETAYQRALACCKNQVERRFLLRRLRALRLP